MTDGMRATFAVTLVLGLALPAAAQDVTRTDAMVAGPPGVAIFVREVVGRSSAAGVAPLLLIHGTPAG